MKKSSLNSNTLNQVIIDFRSVLQRGQLYRGLWLVQSILVHSQAAGQFKLGPEVEIANVAAVR